MSQLVRLENLPEAWEAMRKMGLPVHPIQHRNKTEHDGWKAYYNGAMARDAMAAFEADLELYENAT